MTKSQKTSAFIKMIVMSLIGIFMFFVKIPIGEISTIPLDHIVTFIKTNLSFLVPIYVLSIVVVGAFLPFYNKTWNNNIQTIFFTICKILGVLFTFLVYFNVGPEWLMAKNMGPFLYNVLLVNVGLLVPVGAIFLSFLIGYGFLEFLGVITRPIMRPLFKTPGRSSLDAVASFVGSYSIGLLITNKVYKEGKYNQKEALIIATGFSTVSATFMVVIAKALGLMGIWNTYFFSTLFITFLVTAITVRIPPIRLAKNDFYKNMPGEKEPEYTGNILLNACEEGVKAAYNSDKLLKNVIRNIKDGLLMTANILPTGMSLALFGLVLSAYTPFFEYLGYVFYPFFKIFSIPDAFMASKAAAMSIAECFIPALAVKEAAFITRYVVGVICVSAIIFFAATVPLILGTAIPTKLRDLLIIWIERVILTIIFASLLAIVVL